MERQWRRRDVNVFDVLLSFSSMDPAVPCDDVIRVAPDITWLCESERPPAVYAEDIRQSNEEPQRFAYAASSDLQEPLRSIVGFSQLVEYRYTGRLDTEADEYTAFIVAVACGCGRRFEIRSRSAGRDAGAPPVPIRAGTAAADIISALETPIREVGATVTVGPKPTVMADPGAARPYLLEPHRERADVLPRGRAADTSDLSRADGGVLAVRRGRELDRDRARVLRPDLRIFQRLHSADEYEGTGILLAVVKKGVERHGGEVRAGSTLGEGPTFYFTLPAA